MDVFPFSPGFLLFSCDHIIDVAVTTYANSAVTMYMTVL